MLKHLNNKVSWCSWLSRQSNTLKVSGSSPGDAISSILFYIFNKFWDIYLLIN